MAYLLQHNPYELMSQQEPEKLKELTNFVLEEWSNPELILFSKDFEERLSAKKDLGFSGWNMSNMIRWITTIESNTLKGILGNTCNLKQDILNDYCLPSTPRIDLKHARTASSISGYEALSGQVNLDRYMKEMGAKLMEQQQLLDRMLGAGGIASPPGFGGSDVGTGFSPQVRRGKGLEVRIPDPRN